MPGCRRFPPSVPGSSNSAVLLLPLRVKIWRSAQFLDCLHTVIPLQTTYGFPHLSPLAVEKHLGFGNLALRRTCLAPLSGEEARAMAC